ncbi:MAG: serine protease [Treponema sp.]|jgi:S1-C subfamily serine protease|nr:serine protease [Treponema sp.]
MNLTIKSLVVILLMAGIVLPSAPVSAQSPPAPAGRALRDYVGQLSQSFEPEFAGFLRELKGEFEQRGQREAAGSIEAYLQGNAGTGLVYVAADGTNYIITNYEAISLASGLSIRFEGATYAALSIVAVDEELNLALLSFENGARPFSQGLPLLKRRLREDETVYAAGFSGRGEDWRFAEAVVTGTYVRIPGDDETMRARGPFIRYSATQENTGREAAAQGSPENSGGIVLVTDPGAPMGYAVAGINAGISGYRDYQDPAYGVSDYAVPVDWVEDFLEQALGEGPGDERIALEERLLAFSRFAGLSRPYRHIASYLSSACITDNITGVLPALNDAAGTTIEDIVKAFNQSPARGIKLAVAWTIENRLRNGKPGIDLEVETIEQADAAGYHTGFLVSGAAAGALWVNEHGIWRIRVFDEAAEGPALAETAESTDSGAADGSKLWTSYLFSFSIGYTYVFNQGHALMAEYSFHQWFFAFGARVFYGGEPYLRGESLVGLHFPIRIKNRVGLTPITGVGVGFIRRDDGSPVTSSGRTASFDLGLSVQGGLRLTTSLVPGLFLQGLYQYNYEVFGRLKPSPHSVSVNIGYGF